MARCPLQDRPAPVVNHRLQGIEPLTQLTARPGDSRLQVLMHQKKPPWNTSILHSHPGCHPLPVRPFSTEVPSVVELRKLGSFELTFLQSHLKGFLWNLRGPQQEISLSQERFFFFFFWQVVPLKWEIVLWATLWLGLALLRVLRPQEPFQNKKCDNYHERGSQDLLPRSLVTLRKDQVI